MNRQGVSQLRFIFFGFSTALILYAIVLLQTRQGAKSDSAQVWYAGAALIGIAGVVAAWWARSKALDSRSAATVAGSCRTSFFLGIGFSELAALVGFAGAFITGRIAIYFLGFGFTAVGFALTWPSNALLERRQQELYDAGVSLSLRDALEDPPRRDWKKG